MLLINADERAGQIPVGEPVCHAEILVLPVSAVPGSCSGDIPAEVPDELKHFRHQRSDLPGGIVACEKHIEAGAAAHGAEINGLVRENRVIETLSNPQQSWGESCTQVAITKATEKNSVVYYVRV